MRQLLSSSRGASSMMILILVALLLFIYWEVNKYGELFQMTGMPGSGSASSQKSSTSSPTTSGTDVEVFRWVDDGKP